MPNTYCIYSDREVPEDETNLDHIIPLSLGGCNELTIRAAVVENSRLGAEVDGALTNDPIIALIRSKLGVGGHGSAPDGVAWKKSFLNGDPARPVQIRLPADPAVPLEFWDAKARRMLSREETENVPFKTHLQMDRFSRLRFVAKVVLGAGYFVYGDTFRFHADHRAIRHVVNLDPQDKNVDWAGLDIQVIDQFTPVSEHDKGLTAHFRAFAQQLGASVSFLVCAENIIASVGIFNQWLGAVNFKTDSSQFPFSDGDHRLGQVLSVQNRRLTRRSFWDQTADLARQLKMNVPEAGAMGSAPEG